MSSAIMALRERPQVAEAALNEAVAAGVLNNGADLAKWSLPYNTGASRLKFTHPNFHPSDDDYGLLSKKTKTPKW